MTLRYVSCQQNSSTAKKTDAVSNGHGVPVIDFAGRVIGHERSSSNGRGGSVK